MMSEPIEDFSSKFGSLGCLRMISDSRLFGGYYVKFKVEHKMLLAYKLAEPYTINLYFILSKYACKTYYGASMKGYIVLTIAVLKKDD